MTTRVATNSMSSSVRQRLAVALSVSLLGACDLSTAVKFPSSALVRYDPPAYYALWWDMLMQCSGAKGDLGAVSWFRPSEGRLVLAGTHRSVDIGGRQETGLRSTLLTTA